MDITKLDWFYCESIRRGIIRLSQDEARHLKVKRHYADERIAVFDGRGKVGAGKIVDKDQIEVSEIKEFPKEDFLTIASAVPKGEKFDFMLQKLTELNVSTIIPMKTRYSVVIPKNIERYKRILIEACKQCKRAWIPELKNVTDFSSVLNEEANTKIILDQEGERLKEIPKDKKTLVLIGPEGGFTDEELKEAKSKGFVKTSISKNTLRAETAAIAISAVAGANESR